MKPVIVIPTYNERDNVGDMLKALMELNPRPYVLVVDDSSPDGTAAIVREWESRFPEITLLLRKEKTGQASAFVAGFHHALEAGADVVMTMDCDFSHDPDDVPRLLAATETADLVMGSRYVPGGGTSGWARKRLWLSIAANLFSRFVLSLPLKDCTAGYRAYRADLMRKLMQNPLQSYGYSIQEELLCLAFHRFGAKVVEIPITFYERRSGESKISLKEVTGGLFTLLQLRRRILKSNPSRAG